MNFLEINNISLSLSGKTVLNSVSFKVDKGEVFCICGESGAGKTTLLKIIAGLEEQDTGTIYLNEAIITGPSQNLVPGHPDVTMVFQDTQLSPNRTVAENIAWELRSYSKNFQVQRTAELLKKWKLENLKNLYPRELSGGEKQKTALARAMATNPALLLLDEPFSNMDFLLKNELCEQLLSIVKDESITLIFVTHDTKEALSIAERIAVMKGGNFLQIGSPTTIYNQPVSTYVATFFGAENLLKSEYLRPYFIIADDITEVAIRAEDITISGEGKQLTGLIVTNLYYGAYQLLEVLLDDNLTLKVVIDKNKKYRINDPITIYLAEERIIKF